MNASASLFGLLFGDSEVERLLSDRARVQARLDVEVALAEAEAAAGIVPSTAVEPIRLAARAELYDCEALAADTARAGNIAIPLVEQLRRRVSARDPAAAGYVHWDTTSQDVIDTALVLQLRAAVPCVSDPRVAAHLGAADIDRLHPRELSRRVARARRERIRRVLCGAPGGRLA